MSNDRKYHKKQGMLPDFIEVVDVDEEMYKKKELIRSILRGSDDFEPEVLQEMDIKGLQRILDRIRPKE